jgi:glycosyltransferase involved in cell wall biosynthesis
MKIPSVQEACEWWAYTNHSTAFIEWMYRNIMFRWSSGAMPISHEIESRIRKIAKPDFPLCRVPVLVDPAEKNTQPEEEVSSEPARPVFLWCGMVDGYKRDVLFLIDAMAELKSDSGKNSLLRIVGPCSENAQAELLAYAGARDISDARIDIAGFVSDAQLWNYCSQASALLLPLWDDDRSSTRFPTKLGQYVASGRPVVTVCTGEVKHFLSDATALFYASGNASSLAHALDRLLTDPTLGVQLASRATQDVLPKLDFRSNAGQISKWFSQIYFLSKQKSKI